MKNRYRMKTNNQELVIRRQNESDATSRWIELLKTRPRRGKESKCEFIDLLIINLLLSSSWMSYGSACKKEERKLCQALLRIDHKLFISSSWPVVSRIIFCITNEISSTIISLSSSDKFFLKSWFSSWNYYYITNYHWNLLRFTLYIRS